MSSTARKDGIRTMADLKLRCRVDAETGCWLWAGCTRGASARIWLPDAGIRATAFAVEYLSTGRHPAPGTAWVPQCGNALCCNPAHRRPGTKSELFKAVMPPYTADQRARMTQALRKRSTTMNMAKAAVVRSSEGTLVEIANKHGISVEMASRIRLGKRWFDGVRGSSVFNLAGAA